MNHTLNYLPVYYDFFHSRHRHCILYGGAGSGKSVAAAQKLLIRCITEPGIKVLVVRKTERSLRRSVYAQMESIIAEAGISDRVTFRRGKTDLSITFFNGSQVLFTGCFDADRLKSIQGISSVWVEEATELSEQDFTQLELRVRGHTTGYHQFLLTFNPMDQAHWLYRRFFEGQDLGRQKAIIAEDCFILRTTYADNALLNSEYTKLLGQTLRKDPNMHRVYGLGMWGHVKRGGEFYKHFDSAKHVVPVSYDKKLPLHISFDFNLNPYMTMTVWQADKKELRQIDEFCLSNPLNTTPALCRTFLDKYGRHPSGVSIYGDPTGARGNTQSVQRTSDYGVIMQELESLRPTKMVRASAPPVATRGQFINRLLQGTEGVRIKISPTCLNTIADYLNLQEHTDGTKIKEMHTDKSGIRSQKYGHCSDANDYLLARIFEREIKAMGRDAGPLPKPIIGYDTIYTPGW